MIITFDTPEFLWLVFLIPILIISHFYFLKKSKAKAIKFANYNTLQRITGKKLITKNITHLVIRSLLVFCLILALSGTHFFYQGEALESNIVLALDGSPSMTGQDIAPDRFTASKDAFDLFVSSLDERTNLGLLTFGGVTIINEPLTESKTRIRSALNSAQILTTGGTDISNAIVTGTNMLLAEPDKGKTIIMISDGATNQGAFIGDSITEAVNYARSKGVVIHSITIGTDEGPAGFLQEYYELRNIVNLETLQFISEETGGVNFYADSGEELLDAIRNFEFASEQKMIRVSIGFYAMLVAFIILILDWGLVNTAYRRLI